MAKRSRNQPHRPVPARAGSGDDNDSTERLIARIRDGHLDSQLPALIDVINQRARTLSNLQVRRSLAQLSVGTRVRLNSNVKPRYLQGQSGEVHELDGEQVVVCLDAPVGRFTSGHIRCSPLSLERVDESRT
jgi:hypothetical protein